MEDKKFESKFLKQQIKQSRKHIKVNIDLLI